VTRVPSDDPGSFEPKHVAERLAGAVRRQVLAAAQASLRALREILEKFPAADAEKRRPAKPAPVGAPIGQTSAERTASDAARASTRPGGPLADPPPAELLRSDAALPAMYGSNRLVLLARDPHCLYAYWDLADARLHSVRAQAQSDQLRIVLRTYDVTQVSFDAAPPTRFQDFAVAGDTRSIYAYVGKPAACFVAEVGYLRPDGAFFPLARSLPVWTPRTDQPGAAPGRWMTVGWSERAETARARVSATTTSDGNPAAVPAEAATIATRQTPSSWPGPLPAPGAPQRGSWSLVRGKLTTAASPDDVPAARSEP